MQTRIACCIQVAPSVEWSKQQQPNMHSTLLLRRLLLAHLSAPWKRDLGVTKQHSARAPLSGLETGTTAVDCGVAAEQRPATRPRRRRRRGDKRRRRDEQARTHATITAVEGTTGQDAARGAEKGRRFCAPALATVSASFIDATRSMDARQEDGANETRKTWISLTRLGPVTGLQETQGSRRP